MTPEDAQEIIGRLLNALEESLVKTAAQGTVLRLLSEALDEEEVDWELMVEDTEEKIRRGAAAKFAPIRDMLLSHNADTRPQLLQVEDWRTTVELLIESATDIDLPD